MCLMPNDVKEETGTGQGQKRCESDQAKVKHTKWVSFAIVMWRQSLRNLRLVSSPSPWRVTLTTHLSLARSMAIDYKNLSPMDVEKELFRLKRTMGAYYSRGSYGEALQVARLLQDEVVNIWGPDTAVHASCMVDIGTMLKSLGKPDEAMEQYTKALPLYEKLYGKCHRSYINTLTNVGTLYKFIAETEKEEKEYLENLTKAQEILSEASSLRKELRGE
jgi:tetratricopeptide (TPR) repeat protein